MSGLAECIIAIAENPDRDARADLRRIAAQVMWMEEYLNEVVGDAALDGYIEAFIGRRCGRGGGHMGVHGGFPFWKGR